MSARSRSRHRERGRQVVDAKRFQRELAKFERALENRRAVLNAHAARTTRRAA